MHHPFALIRPTNLVSARAQVLQQPEKHVLRAGGIDLLDRIKESLDTPDALVELRPLAAEVPELRAVNPGEDGSLTIGTLVTLAELASDARMPAAVREAAGSAATPTIRNVATLGGNLLQRPRCWYYRNVELHCLKKGGKACLAVTGENRYHAILGGGPSFIVHPSTLACALLAVDAEVEIVGEAARVLPISELFVGPKTDPTREHILQPGEILTRVRVPAGEHRSGYAAVKEKQSHDWPLAEAAVQLTFTGTTISAARVVLGHVAPTPWRSREAEAELVGKDPSIAVFQAAALAAVGPAKPMRHNAYKVPLVVGLLRQVLHHAANLPLPE